MESLSLVSTFMQSVSGGSAAAGLVQTEEAMRLKEAERDVILVELVSAVGLQRLRFDSGTLFVLRTLCILLTLEFRLAHAQHIFSLLFFSGQQQARQHAGA